MTDSTRTFTDSSRWSAYTAQPAPRPQEQRHDMQVAITVLDMIITIAPVVLLAAIWSKLDQMLQELRKGGKHG
jgi:hypothetical protein